MITLLKIIFSAPFAIGLVVGGAGMLIWIKVFGGLGVKK
jgi:hypothetical protein